MVNSADKRIITVDQEISTEITNPLLELKNLYKLYFIAATSQPDWINRNIPLMLDEVYPRVGLSNLQILASLQVMSQKIFMLDSSNRVHILPSGKKTDIFFGSLTEMVMGLPATDPLTREYLGRLIELQNPDVYFSIQSHQENMNNSTAENTGSHALTWALLYEKGNRISALCRISHRLRTKYNPASIMRDVGTLYREALKSKHK